MISSPVRVPDMGELRRLRQSGRVVGYEGIYIYLRYRAILRMLAGERLGPTLSVGCGYGIFDRLLPEDLDFTGIDVSPAEIEVASAWARAHRPRYRYLCGRLRDQPFREGSFDLVVLSEVLEHVHEAEAKQLLVIALALLRTGGRLLVTVPNHWTLRNRSRRLFLRPAVLMDRTHLREYDLGSALRLFDGLGVRRLRLETAVLYFPFEKLVARVLAPESRWRESIIRALPAVASHFLLLGIKDER